MQKLFLIDAFAILYRSFFAFSKNPIQTSKGLNTSALYGLGNLILELIQKENPTHLVVAFDAPAEGVRAVEFSDYKANRDAMPEGIAQIIPYCYSFLEAFGIPYFLAPGYEADDIIGTFQKQFASENCQVYMVTPDKDYGQLVDKNSFIYRPKTGGGYEILDEKAVCEKMGVAHPLQIIDLLALWGDASDNIPGIPGVGEKTAQKLLAQYGSLEKTLEYAKAQKGKLGENLSQYAQQGVLSKMLATIITDVPLEVSLSDLLFRGVNVEKMQPLIAELEFKSLGKKILSLAGEKIVATDELLSLKKVEYKYYWVKTEQELSELIQKLEQNSYFSFDTETTGLNPHRDEILILSFALNKNEAFCIDVRDFLSINHILTKLKPIFEDNKKTIIAQNIKFDYKFLLKYGLKIKNKIFDTMIAHYLLFPEKNHNLEYLASFYLNYQGISIVDLIGPKGKNQKTMDQVPAEILLDYAGEDVDLTLQLYFLLGEDLKKDPQIFDLFEKIEMPLIPILADMEWKGILIDRDFLTQYSKEVDQILTQAQEEIFTMADLRWNLDSPKQLGEVLFEKLKITDKVKKTKTGQYATSEEELKNIDHPIAGAVLRYREWKKLKSTYIDAFLDLIEPSTSRLHTSFIQTGTVTGRLASKDPNLQNIPVKTEQGRQIRRAFVAKENCVLVAADYSQIELRLMAYFSQDQQMLSDFNKNLDIHQATASKIYNVNLEDVKDWQRRNAKAVNFGIIYGQTPFGLSQNLGISSKEAKAMIDAYFEQYPGVKKYMEQVVKKAEKEGFVRTFLGRKRNLPDIHSVNAVLRNFAQRNAINSPLQGTAADLIKLAMLKITEQIKAKNWPIDLLLQVHDELIFEVPRNLITDFSSVLKQSMEEALQLEGICFVAQVGYGENGLDLQ